MTGAAKKTWKDDPALVAATQQYATWVTGEVKELVTGTDAFTAAVKAGRTDEAKTLYGKARIHYERIEPTAEIWGDIDGRIDGRIDDAATPADFTGFHRIEQALWEKNSTGGPRRARRPAERRRHDLYTKVQTVEYQPAEIANGATDLVDEIQSSKITGEEERYSHIDLLDFDGNLDGANEAVTVLLPALKTKDPALAATVDTSATRRPRPRSARTRPARLRDRLRRLQQGHRRRAARPAQAVNALRRAVSKIAGKIAEP